MSFSPLDIYLREVGGATGLRDAGSPGHVASEGLTGNSEDSSWCWAAGLAVGVMWLA